MDDPDLNQDLKCDKQEAPPNDVIDDDYEDDFEDGPEDQIKVEAKEQTIDLD